jgi:hypothetical protein
VFLEGLLPESGFVGHHYSVLKERLRVPARGPLVCIPSLGPPAQRVSTSPWPSAPDPVPSPCGAVPLCAPAP